MGGLKSNGNNCWRVQEESSPWTTRAEAQSQKVTKYLSKHSRENNLQCKEKENGSPG